MPLWVAAYIAIYILFCAWCVGEEIKRRHKKWICADVVFEIGSVAIASAYWLPEVRTYIEPLALALFIGTVIWNLVEATRGFQQLYFDSSLPSHHNILKSLSGVALGVIICLPLFYWGFLYAVRGDVDSIL